MTYSFAKLDLKARSGLVESVCEELEDQSIRGVVPGIRFDNRFMPVETITSEPENPVMDINLTDGELVKTTSLNIYETASHIQYEDLIDLSELDTVKKEKKQKDEIFSDDVPQNKKKFNFHKQRIEWRLYFDTGNKKLKNRKYVFYDEEKNIYKRGKISENCKGLYYVRVTRETSNELRDRDSRESKKLEKEWKRKFKEKALEHFDNRWRPLKNDYELYEKIAGYFQDAKKGTEVLHNSGNIKRYIEQDDIPRKDEDFREILNFSGISDPHEQDKYIQCGRERNRQRRNNGRETRKLTRAELETAEWSRSVHGEMECRLGEFRDRHCVRHKIVNVTKLKNKGHY